MFLLYWAGMLRQDLRAFFPSLVGGLLGIGIGWQLIAIPPVAGLIGQIGLGCASFFINDATMLYLLKKWFHDEEFVLRAENKPLYISYVAIIKQVRLGTYFMLGAI